MHLKLRDDIKTASKAKDKEMLGALRSILAMAQDIALKDNRKDITNDDVVVSATKLVKEGNEGMDIYRVISSPIANENFARNYLLANTAVNYLPKQYTEEELKDVVSVIIGTLECSNENKLTMKDMGKVMGEVKSQLPNGSYDAKLVSTIVKENLN